MIMKKQINLIFIIFYCFINAECGPIPFPHGLNTQPNPFSKTAGLQHRNDQQLEELKSVDFNQENKWGFENVDSNNENVKSKNVRETNAGSLKKSEFEQGEELKTAIRNAQLGITTTDLPPDPRHNGLLKDIGSVGVGFGVGVGVPGNDPVSVSTGVHVGLDGSGPAGGLPPFTETIFPRQGENISLNDYDGNKDLIMSGKAWQYYYLTKMGFIKIPQYAPVKSLVGINSGIGIGTNNPTNG